MLWVGITGSMGSGKSTVSEIVSELGYPVISADNVARLMTSRDSIGLNQIVTEFGPTVVDKNGELNRTVLGKLVFGREEKLKILERILHPLIQEYVRLWRENEVVKGQTMSFYDIPLLFENHLESQFDKVICVVASEDNILSRVKTRSGLSEQDIKTRLLHQVPVEEKIKKSDFVIENNGDKRLLKSKVKKVLHQITNPMNSQS